MIPVTPVRIYSEVFTRDEISTLNAYYANKEYTVEKFDSPEKLKYKNKNNDYEVEGSLPNLILRPKITEILGDHKMQFGAYLESHRPFGAHVDTNKNFQDNNNYHHLSDLHRNVAILIPLCEHPDCNTIFWKYWADSYNSPVELPSQRVDPIDLGPLLGHMTEEQKYKLSYLELDKIFSWKLGSLAVWDRRQLHAASDFTKSMQFKTAITIFV